MADGGGTGGSGGGGAGGSGGSGGGSPFRPGMPAEGGRIGGEMNPVPIPGGGPAGGGGSSGGAGRSGRSGGGASGGGEASQSGSPDGPAPAPGMRGPSKPGFDEAVMNRASAYPGTLTYVDLIRRNKRESVLLVVGMVALGTVIGAVFGALAGAVLAIGRDYAAAAHETHQRGGTPSDADSAMRFFESITQAEVSGMPVGALVPWMLIGGAVALVIASFAAAWCWHRGSNALLKLMHAKPVAKEDDPELYNVVEEMSIAAGLPMPAVYILDEDALNAFATGRDPQHAAIGVTRGLREKLTRDELQGVVAHEMAHIRHYDVRMSMLMATMVGLIVVACDSFRHVGWRMLFYGSMTSSGRAGGRMGGGRVGGRGGGGGGGGRAGAAILLIVVMIIAMIVMTIAPLVARILQMSYSRRREYLADAGAVELTRNPSGLASALRRLAEDSSPQVDTANRGTAHMFIVNPTRKMRRSQQGKSTLFCSHPPLKERVARLVALMR